MRSVPPPILIVNFKNYHEALGDAAVRLAGAAARVSRETGVDIAVAPPAPSLQLVASRVPIRVFSQSLNGGEAGKSTGAVIPEAVKAAGCAGSILNHSESKVSLEFLQGMVPRARSLGLGLCLCAETTQEAVRIAPLEPDFLAVEPPDLIGSGIAVSKARPELITETGSALSRADFKGSFLCGAGVVTGEDVRAALKLGANGVLVASSVVKAKDWHQKLTELTSAMTG